MTPVSWHPLARQELFEASSFYDGESSGLGEVFLDAVEQALEHLRIHPEAGPVVLRQARRYLVARFPYSIIYRCDEEAASRRPRLFVLAIAHHKRRPRYWASRR